MKRTRNRWQVVIKPWTNTKLKTATNARNISRTWTSKRARGRLWIEFNETNNEKPLKSKVRDRQENNSKTFFASSTSFIGAFFTFIHCLLLLPYWEQPMFASRFNWRLFAHWFLLFYLVAFCAPHASLPTVLWYKMCMAYEELYDVMY